MKRFVLAMLLAAAGVAHATEYETQAIKVDAKASRCLEQSAGEKEARDRVAADAANICREKGYGWHVQEVKSAGNVACSPCESDKTRCQATNVELICRRLKPGSTGMGMLPFLGTGFKD
ncbi:hypothetical protein [Methylogaea oryzae]|uniref:Uncharacterized protein n=1 Tax=Methylogaea oryzae TaxID=1295382 RepID=A0A8D4VUT2_9GAMM|nr:hypothetical protein [Methylogaea oryzae]BBL72859.1 hypothetical protein MoryE10_34650 [Methylogaea oryzae]